MLNVTIQNDGKIKFQSECSSTKDMRHNVNLLLAVVSYMEMEETVRTLSLQLNMPIERAKAIVDTAADDKHDILLSQSPDESFINTMKDTLESAGCICRITNGF
jgi:hypothetical protein